MNDKELTFEPKPQGFMIYPENQWHKALFKWPVHLWRLGLAPVIGHHMLLISHTGRKSGLVRRTMTERYRLEDRSYAPCAFGEQAQWYKNMAADPRVTIQTADGAMSAIASRVTDDEELLALISDIGQRSSGLLEMYLDYLDISPEPDDIIAKKDRIYWIRFDPTEESTPAPLEADLVWIWPVALVAGLVLLIAGLLKKRA